MEAEAGASDLATGVSTPLPASGTASGGPTTPEDDEGWELRWTKPVAVSGALTVGLALSTLTTGLLAMRAESDFDDAVARSNDPTLSDAERAAAVANGLDASDKADRRALATDVLLGATVVGAAVTTYFVVRDGRPDEDVERAQVTASPTVGRGGGGVVLRGSF
jgi:hypothetical protein